MMLSITVPVFNEAENLPLLYEKLTATLASQARPWEVIFVNDGSRDYSAAVLDRLAAGDPRIKVVHFRRNFGQTAAMMAGVDFASGEIIKRMPDPATLETAEAVYETWPGWDGPTSQARSWDDLPLAARRYLLRIQELTGAPIRWVSVGPEREAIITIEG